MANYKATKIQTDLITLNISSEQSENTGNLNYAIKDALYDENTIDQKLLDFVKNVNFSLDYTENDYGTDKDGKKGEILINNIIIGYKNSKNTFTVSNLDTKKAISSAINDDSGITTKWSKNLWSSIKDRYNDVVSVVDLKKLKDATTSEITSVENARIEFLLIHGASVVLIAAMIAWFIIAVCRKYSFKDNWGKTLMTVVIGLICFGGLIWAIYEVVTRMGSSWENLNDKLNDIEPTTTSYQIIKNIDNDEKYFVPKDAKAEFDKKVYYESGYKLTKGETESDLTKYLGGKKAHEDLIANIEDVLETYNYMFIITAIIAVATIIITIIIRNLKKVPKINLQQLPNIDNANKVVGSIINNSFSGEVNEAKNVISFVVPF